MTIGKGHLAEAKAAINPDLPGRAAMNGAQSAFSRKEAPHRHEAHVGSHCGSGDTTERDELLAKIAEAKRAE